MTDKTEMPDLIYAYWNGQFVREDLKGATRYQRADLVPTALAEDKQKALTWIRTGSKGISTQDIHQRNISGGHRLMASAVSEDAAREIIASLQTPSVPVEVADKLAEALNASSGLVESRFDNGEADVFYTLKEEALAAYNKIKQGGA